LDEMYALCGDLIWHAEVHWLNWGNISVRFQELLSQIMEFLQERVNLTPQIKDYWYLLDVSSLTDLTAKLN
jgi:hypothetical protein